MTIKWILCRVILSPVTVGYMQVIVIRTISLHLMWLSINDNVVVRLIPADVLLGNAVGKQKALIIILNKLLISDRFVNPCPSIL